MYSRSIRSTGSPEALAGIWSEGSFVGDWALIPMKSEANPQVIWARIVLKYIHLGWKQSTSNLEN